MPATPPDEFVIETPVEDEIWRREQARYLAKFMDNGQSQAVLVEGAAGWGRAAVESYRAQLPKLATVLGQPGELMQDGSIRLPVRGSFHDEDERALWRSIVALGLSSDLAWGAVGDYRDGLASLESLAAENSHRVSPAPTPAEGVSLGEAAPSHPLADFVRHGCVACPIPAQELRPGDMLFHAEARHSVVSVHPYTHGGIATGWELKQGVRVRVGDYSLDFARDAQVVVLRKVANDGDAQPIPDDQKLHALGLLRTLATAFGSAEDGVHAEALGDLKRLIRDVVSNAPIEEPTEDAPLESVAAQADRDRWASIAQSWHAQFTAEKRAHETTRTALEDVRVDLEDARAEIEDDTAEAKLKHELAQERELTRNATQILCNAFGLDSRGGHIVDKALTAARRYELAVAGPIWIGREDMLKQSTELRRTLTAALGPLPTDHPHLLAAIRSKLEGTSDARDPELDADWPLPDGYSWVDPTMIECVAGRAWITGERFSMRAHNSLLQAATLNPSAVAVLFDRWRARQGQPIADPPKRGSVAIDHEKSDPATLTALGLAPHPDRVIAWLAEPAVNPTPWKLIVDRVSNTQRIEDAEGARIYGRPPVNVSTAFVEAVNAACARVEAGELAPHVA